MRAGLEFPGRQTAGDPRHFHHILDPLRSKRIGVDHLVGQCQHIVMRVQMPDRSMDVDRLDRISGIEADAVIGLRQAQQILIVGAVADPASAVQIHDVRRRRHLPEIELPATDSDLPVRVARCDGECGGRLRRHLVDEIAVHPDPLCLAIDRASGCLEDIKRIIIQKEDADILEDPHAGLMDGFHTLFIDRLRRIVEVTRRAPLQLFGQEGRLRRGLATPAAAAGAALGFGCNVGHEAPRMVTCSDGISRNALHHSKDDVS